LKHLLKYIWLVTFVVALALFIVSVYKSGFSKNYPLLLISALALLMFWLRKKMNEQSK